MKTALQILSFTIFFNFSCISQNMMFTKKITYLESTNLGDGNFEDNYDLYFNNDIAFYQQQYSTKDQEIKHESDGSTITTLFANENNAGYYLTFLNSNRILFGEEIAFNYYNFEENVPQIRWNQIDETKTIGKFQCKKAIGKFRGRIYTAWYTEEIPINIGPRKFRGLSGLILEINDDKGVYKAKAIKINLGEKANLEKKISSLFFINKRLDINQYAKKKSTEQLDALNYLNSKQGENGIKFSLENQTKREFIEIF
nr:GLPGLI family protein [uncultured Flavobacterium sp.]